MSHSLATSVISFKILSVNAGLLEKLSTDPSMRLCLDSRRSVSHEACPVAVPTAGPGGKGDFRTVPYTAGRRRITRGRLRERLPSRLFPGNGASTRISGPNIPLERHPLSPEFLAFLILGAVAGGFVNGLAGFGTSLFALGWWLQILQPVQAVALVLVLSVASGLQGAWVVRKSIQPKRLAVFLVPALVGIPIGLQILRHIDVEVLKLVVAGFLLIYAVFFIARRNLPSMTRETPLADAAIGFAGGILGAVAGLSGALPTMWLTLRDWTRQQTRAVLQPFNIIVLGISAVMLAFDGAFDRQTLMSLAIALPATMLAAQAGLFVFGRLTDVQFRWLLVVLMLVSGTMLGIRTIV